MQPDFNHLTMATLEGSCSCGEIKVTIPQGGQVGICRKSYPQHTYSIRNLRPYHYVLSADKPLNVVLQIVSTAEKRQVARKSHLSSQGYHMIRGG